MQRQELIEQELVQEDESFDATPICKGNYYTPVSDTSMYLDEISCVIAGRKYIENAD